MKSTNHRFLHFVAKIICVAVALCLIITAVPTVTVFSAVADRSGSNNAEEGLTLSDSEIFYAFGVSYLRATGKTSPDYVPGTLAPDGAVFLFLEYAHLMKDYIDQNTNKLSIPYDNYIALVDRSFTFHSDMKDYLIENNCYNAETDMVEYYMGGLGSDWDWLYTNSTYHGGYATLEGVYLDGYLESTDGLTEFYDYYTYHYDGIEPYSFAIKECTEVTINSFGEYNQYRKIDGYTTMNYYQIANKLYAKNDSGKLAETFKKLDYHCDKGATISIEDGSSPKNELSTIFRSFNGSEYTWIPDDIDEIQFSIETGSGYELTNVYNASSPITAENGIYTADFSDDNVNNIYIFITDNNYTLKDGVQIYDDTDSGVWYRLDLDLDENISFDGIVYGSGSPYEITKLMKDEDGVEKLWLRETDEFYSHLSFEIDAKYTYGDIELADSADGRFFKVPGINVISVKINKPTTLTVHSAPFCEISGNGATLTAPTEDYDFYSKTTLNKNEINADSDEFKAVESAVGDGFKDIQALNITLVSAEDNTAVQPKGEVTVTVSVPTGWDASLTKVFFIDEDGNKTDMKAYSTNGGLTVSFKTTHLSTYAMALSDNIAGDIDFDGNITVSDVVALRKIIMSGSFTDSELKAGDLDSDGKLSVSDVVALRKKIMQG